MATSYYWVSSAYGKVHERAVEAGKDKDGGPLFVGRARHEDDLLPAKVAPNHGGAFVSWNCLEHSKFIYEVRLPLAQNLLVLLRPAQLIASAVT